MAIDTQGRRTPLPVRSSDGLPVHEGKGFIVTGAARGLGRAVAERLLDQGARIVMADISADQLEVAAAALGGSDRVRAVAFDLADADSVHGLVDEAAEFLGVIDGVANVGAIVGYSDAVDTDRHAWRRMFEINVIGNYDVAQLAAQHMIGRGVRGAIVNVASEAGKNGHVDMVPYSASKAAVINATRMLSDALAKHDINVNCVCPGQLNTEMLRSVANRYAELTRRSADDLYDEMKNIQLHRHVEPIEVARVISFLLSDDALVIRGQAINVDAGGTYS